MRADLVEQQFKNEAMLRKLAMEFEFHRSKVEEERLSMATQVNILAQEVSLPYGTRSGTDGKWV